MADPKSDARPDNREVENENLRPDRDGQPPRPATEPKGAKDSQQGDTRTDPGSGAPVPEIEPPRP